MLSGFIMNQALKHPGAKLKLADWIIDNIPSHSVYLEPFFGSGAVFFNKSKSEIETINDINNDVYNYFKVLRDYPEELITALSLTPYSRKEYIEAYYMPDDNDNCIEKARKFAVRCYMGFGASNRYKNGFRSSQMHGSPDIPRCWKKLPDTLYLASNRLLDAQIENLDYKELLSRYNTEDVFIYLDPPYLQNTRKACLYKNEMDLKDHEELLNIILKHSSKIMISGYSSPLYDDALKRWKKITKNNVVEGGLIREEVLWMNYETEPMLFNFDEIGE